jgi:hypothetical protein
MDFEYVDPANEARGLPVHPAEDFLAAMARGMVEAQRALDEVARESIIRWEKDAIAPSAYMWSLCKADFTTVLGCSPKPDAGELTRMSIAPRHTARGGVSFAIRYQPIPLEEP